ncbi:chorismate synthase [Candidatus Aerophobetes bacterium]|nr:chorismate synthase [Candidatus Aerophobetes bacterium]
MSTKLRYLTAGESHGKGLILVIEGIPSGVFLEEGYILRELERRRKGYGRGERMRIEKDKVRIISGVRWGKTLGSPISLFIPNIDWKNWKNIMSPRKVQVEDYTPFTRPRPGHADLVGGIKYNFSDLRNTLERASARETAARVAAGAICKRVLEEFGIKVFSRTVQIGRERDKTPLEVVLAHYEKIEASLLRCFDEDAEKSMISLIEEAKKRGDSLGGIFEVIITGLPPGLGSYIQWDLKLDARIAYALMSIQAIVGVEIGAGFEGATFFGSEFQDEIAYDKERGFYRLTNRAGGIEGGMTTGEPILVRAAMKPISTLRKPLKSVDILTKSVVEAGWERSDVCAVPSASVVAEAVCSVEILRAMREKFGGDSLEEMKKNYSGYLEYVKKR